MSNAKSKFAVLLTAAAMAVGCTTDRAQTANPSKATDAVASTKPAYVPASAPTSKPAAPFANEIEAFEKADAEKMPAKNGIVFYGSSTIRIWKTAEAFPDLPTLNRGFGGSQMEHALLYERRALTKYQPKVVVLYEGDNDLAAGDSPEQVMLELTQLASVLHAEVPAAKLVICSAKPSESREGHRAKIDALNAQFAAFAREHADWVTFFDAVPLMIDANGKPIPELYRADKLHMSDAGYARWNQAIRPLLERLMNEAN